jgi:hypothetical protein
MKNYLNWSAVILREKLSEANISASSSFPLSVLKKLYADNVLGKETDASNIERPAVDVNSANASAQTNSFPSQIIPPQNSSVVSEHLPDSTTNASTTYQNMTTSGDSRNPAVVDTLVHTVQSLQTMVSSLTTLITSRETTSNSPPTFNLQQFYLVRGNETTQSPRKFGTNPEDLPQLELISNFIRKNIIDGTDVNLASLLIPYYELSCT